MSLKCLSEVLLDCDYDNLGSASSIISLGGKLVKEGINEISNTVMKDFVINVDESLNKYSSLYEPQISDKNFELQPNDNGLKR